MITSAVKATGVAFVMLLAVTNTVSAQDRAEAGAVRMTDKMKTELTLTDAQYPKVLEINKEFVTKTLETKKGNAISNGILYLVLCELLDIPVRATNIPRQFILAYYDPQYQFMKPGSNATEKISFFVDPLNGQIYSHKDVENYFKRISVPPTSSYFRKLTNKRIIQFLLEELSKCFDNDRNRYKMEELLLLAKLLDE